MNVYFTYGKVKSDLKKKEQTIYVRLFYGRNKLQIKASTQLTIKKQGWNFKKGEEAGVVDLMKGTRTYEESQHLQQIKEKLEHIRSYLKNEFRILRLSQKHSAFSQNEWNEWGREHFEIALGIREAKSEKAPLFMTKYEEYISFYKRNMSKNTIDNYETIRKKLNEFQEYKKHEYRTNEIDLNFYKDFEEWCFAIKNHAPSTFGGYISKIKAVINHFRGIEPNFKFHVNIDHKSFYAPDEAKEKEILEMNELEKLWNYKGKEKLENVRDIAKLLYFVCLRWSEFHFQFKENETKPLKIYQTKDGYLWDIYEKKVKHRKGIPVHSKISQMFNNDSMPYYIAISNFNEYIKELLTEIGIEKHITSHCFRKSFCVNNYVNGITEEDIMQYSGHKSVKALRAYINIDKVQRKNEIPTE